MWIDEEGKRHPTVVDSFAIYGFFGDYRWLSNYHLCKIELDGKIYNSSEAAYMAQKTLDFNEKKLFEGDISPRQAKKWGTQITLRLDWEYYRIVAMMQVLTAKFTQNEDLYSLLMLTDGMHLQETNNWGDTFWGVDFNTKEGYNMLGKCLMAVREAIK